MTINFQICVASRFLFYCFSPRFAHNFHLIIVSFLVFTTINNNHVKFSSKDVTFLVTLLEKFYLTRLSVENSFFIVISRFCLTEQ